MERLFSYGTLRFERVQIETFGQKLKGSEEVLLGYELSEVVINDEAVIEKSGTNIHPILKFTGSNLDEVEGMVFEITHEELKQADEYEVDSYSRTIGKLKSSDTAWIYSEA